MKKIPRPAKFINILLASAILIFSCKDENTLENLNQRNLQASHDYLLIEKTIVDIEREIEHAFISTQTTKELPNYISLNNDTSNQDTLIINFGDENFLHLGHIKRGEINIIYNQFLYNSGAIINTTFTDFYINNNLVQGTITLENNGFNENSNLEFKLSVNNLSLNTENGIINLTGEYSKELKNGYSTQYDYIDNLYHVIGSAEGNSVNNNSFSVVITDPLKYDLSCFESSSCIISQGIVSISPSIYSERTLDYGEGGCNCDISVSAGDETYPLIIN